MNSYKTHKQIFSLAALLLGLNQVAAAACEAELETQINANAQWNANAIQSQRNFHEATMRKGYVNEARTKSQIADSLSLQKTQLTGQRDRLRSTNNPTDRKMVEGWIADAEYAVCISYWALKSAPEK